MGWLGKHRHHDAHKVQRRLFDHTALKCGVGPDASALIAELTEQTPGVIDEVSGRLPQTFPADVADSILTGSQQSSARLEAPWRLARTRPPANAESPRAADGWLAAYPIAKDCIPAVHSRSKPRCPTSPNRMNTRNKSKSRRRDPTHDSGYTLLYSHAAMVRDLLRGFVPGAWVQVLDLAILERCSESYVSDDLRDRADDLVWRLRWGSDWLYVYLLLEFQSTVDPWMAVRIQTYLGLLYQDLIRAETLRVCEKTSDPVPRWGTERHQRRADRHPQRNPAGGPAGTAARAPAPAAADPQTVRCRGGRAKRPPLDRIDNAQALEDLAEALLDSTDGAAWLQALTQAAP